ncbi:AAA family ATPase [Clostridium senegalense]|uniref:MoxR family ATPase n=1 Tax=Clostridium senegalense TaxID=1465809 RepID=A0A6M0H1X2_9CLOT|nr:MoxR family ATPase [Clostridium senegalense]NEU04517.1 MoxR family ATPase [Clostridium senegalense]
MDIKVFGEFKKKVKENVGKVIVGKEENIDKIIVAFITSGHVLLEDVPGLGKTKLARSLSKTMGCTFKRIQFTPDLLPSDLTGIYFYNQKDQEFEFRKGPLLSQIVLADEINRATPRTQSALLECMEERQVTVEGNTIKLDEPFFVIATQNPIEQFGTFPLPEAQLDRFFMKISMGYPNYNEEKSMMERFMESDPLDTLKSVITLEEIKYVQNNYCKVHISDEIKDYILNIVVATRNNTDIELGCSPRVTLGLMKGCQAYAAISGRDYVIPEDVKALAVSVMAHRIVLKSEINVEKDKANNVINLILSTVKTPIETI